MKKSVSILLILALLLSMLPMTVLAADIDLPTLDLPEKVYSRVSETTVAEVETVDSAATVTEVSPTIVPKSASVSMEGAVEYIP